MTESEVTIKELVERFGFEQHVISDTLLQLKKKLDANNGEIDLKDLLESENE